METMKDRLILLCRELHLGQNAFEKSCGWATGTICTLKKGVRTDKFVGLMEAYPTLNIKWLITGDGEMWESIKEYSEDFRPKEQGTPSESININVSQEWFLKQIMQKDSIIERLLSVIENGNRY